MDPLATTDLSPGEALRLRRESLTREFAKAGYLLTDSRGTSKFVISRDFVAQTAGVSERSVLRVERDEVRPGSKTFVRVEAAIQTIESHLADIRALVGAT